MIYYLYWIRKKDFKNILTEGYVGVSKNIDKRFKEHLYKMKNNIHENKLLQRNFNKHELIFEKILCGNKEYCFYIENKLRPSKNIGWNNNIGGTSPPSCEGKILTENHKLKISNSKKGKSRPKFSDEWMRRNGEVDWIGFDDSKYTDSDRLYLVDFNEGITYKHFLAVCERWGVDKPKLIV